ncbi:hypothetical protein BZZ01_12085 [Nostocales cyanobacterium HT-58-2]|nr:hypothetical protein BZZ01_12085 [Nostocales cyanobacterium HT-58-2]
MSLNQALPCPIKQMPNEEEKGFDYSILDQRTKIFLQQHTQEIKSLIRRTAQDIVNIGQKLLEAKEQLGHGHFENWLQAEFNWGQWTARKFMQVTRQFQSVNFTDLSIDTSALYVLASPSTPEVVRQEALKRARQGEVITHAKVKAITKKHKEVTKFRSSSYDTMAVTTAIGVTTESTIQETSNPTEQLQVSSALDTQIDNITEQSNEKLLNKETRTLEHFQVSNHSHNKLPNTDHCNDSLNDPQEIETQSLFGVGHLLCITDINLKDHEWLGEVAEITEATDTDIKVVIRISLQPPTDRDITKTC